MNVLRHFELLQEPFSKELPDQALWLPPSKQHLLDALHEAIARHQSVLLTGDPGVGKTCLLRALRHSLPTTGYKLTYCHNATLGRRDFYRQLCLALGLDPSATAASVFYAVSGHVQDLAREKAYPVFLLDEAHLLHQDVLDHLHILLNYEWDSRALLSLVLVGLPELEERLRLRRNRSLFSRLATRLQVETLTPDDTAHYLSLRLNLVGCTREVFSRSAAAMLHEAAGGSMRDIDRIAHVALSLCANDKRQLVEREHIAEALDIAA